jgi:DNA-binding NtrC family response regulator
MSDSQQKILVVEADAELADILSDSLRTRLDAIVTCVQRAEECLQTDLHDPHDLVIAECGLDASDGLELAEHLNILSPRPIILLAERASSAAAIEAMRLGVADLFVKPFPIARLLESVERALEAFDLRTRHALKYRRMRELVRRVIRERRDMSRRMELVCRDLVEAHRRLVQRVDATRIEPSH